MYHMFLSLLAIVVSLRPWHRLHEECTTMALEVATQRHKSHHPKPWLYMTPTQFHETPRVLCGWECLSARKIHCELYQNEGNLEFLGSFKGSRIFKKRSSNVYRKKWDFKNDTVCFSQANCWLMDEVSINTRPWIIQHTRMYNWWWPISGSAL